MVSDYLKAQKYGASTCFVFK